MTKLIIALGFLIAFAAGLMVGLNRAPEHARPARPPGPGDRGSWLAAQLQLSAEQQEQLKEIWSETASRGGRRHGEDRRQLRRQRDEAIAALIPSERQSDYERIIETYNRQNEQLDAELRQSYERAVERTKAILTPEQRKIYEEILSRQSWDGPRDRPRPGTRPAEPNH